jgi:hypothetical protein
MSIIITYDSYSNNAVAPARSMTMAKLIGFERKDGKKTYIDPTAVTAVVDSDAGTVLIFFGKDQTDESGGFSFTVKGTADEVAESLNAERL